MAAIVECVPNFSEGRDLSVIERIAGSIASHGCKLLHQDAGYDANRTVITFAGEPQDVFQGAFAAVRTASQLIDMSLHHGAHPRSGATDVLPLVPVSGITLAECATMARSLAEKIFLELGIPCYLYGEAALTPAHYLLEDCRRGEYEALPSKTADAALRPDFSERIFSLQAKRSGAINVGARGFLIAVNFNLDTEDVGVAKSIALDVRARGRQKKDAAGLPVLGKDGKPQMIPGLLPGCKAIGWYMEEYGCAQVSMNITDICLTPLHTAYETVCRQAQLRGHRVTGTEIIGLVPARVLVDAGRHFAGKNCKADDYALMELASEKLGLGTIKPYDIRRRVIEFLI